MVSDLATDDCECPSRSAIERILRTVEKPFALMLSPAIFFKSLLTTIPRMRVPPVVFALAILVMSFLCLTFSASVLPQSSGLEDAKKSAYTLANNASSFAMNLPLYIYPTTDVPYNMTIQVKDLDNDTVNVTWEWGDGSPNATNITPPALSPAWVNQTHVWSVPREQGRGDYNATFRLNITLDDGMGGITRTQRYALVYVPADGIPAMDLTTPVRVDPGDETLIVANASDPEGDPLTWTFVFNDSVTEFLTEVYHTPASAPNETIWHNITYIFGVEGNYTIRLNVSDALPPYQIWPHNVSLTASIRAIFNHLPEVIGVIDTDPQSLIINGTIGYLEVNYSIEAFDPDGDVLYVVWDFGDGSPSVINLSAGGTEMQTFVQQRNYTDPGIFNISVVVSDNRTGHDILVYRDLKIISNNLPPSVVSFAFTYSENRSFGLPNETISFTLAVTDPELNAIEIIVDFGDNSALEYYNLTDFVRGNVSLVLSHSYESQGEYQVIIWYTDNKIGYFEHEKYYNATVTVIESPQIIHHNWTTWDYISLSLFTAAFISPVLWAIIGMRRRRRLDETYIPSSPEPSRVKDGDVTVEGHKWR